MTRLPRRLVERFYCYPGLRRLGRTCSVSPIDEVRVRLALPDKFPNKPAHRLLNILKAKPHPLARAKRRRRVIDVPVNRRSHAEAPERQGHGQCHGRSRGQAFIRGDKDALHLAGGRVEIAWRLQAERDSNFGGGKRQR